MNIFDCPFCKKPSAISCNDQFFCFSCGMGGDRVAYLRALKKISYKEASKRVKGVLMDEENRNEEKEKVLYALAEAENFFFSSPALHKFSFFEKRKLSAETVKAFHLGYSDGGKHLYNHLIKKGIEKETMEAAGLICTDPETGEVYEKFWKRIIFPINDENGNVIGFGGRVTGDESPKYLNSPESLVFDKSHNLYALDKAKSSSEDFFLLTEGYIDVISLHQNGFNNAVASLGTSFTYGQAELIAKYKRTVLLIPDNDTPGQNAAKKTVSILLKKGLNVKVVSVAPYKDVDEFLVKEGSESLRKKFDTAESGQSFLIKEKSAKELAAFIFENS